MSVVVPAETTVKQSAIISLLHSIQEREGYLPVGEIARVARETGMSAAHVMGIATFYNHFRLRPPGQHKIKVCDGTACHVKGARRILDRIQSELGVNPGETTEDNVFSLEVVACLGACSMAPAIVVDDDVYGRVTTKDLRRIFNKYRRQR
jgi:NADH-quinone oxidoreductase subunit E